MTEVEVRGHQFQLLPERAAFHIASQTLLVADLHWGKAEVFQLHGIAVSSRVLEDDLLRLSQALLRTQAKRLIVLGDLVHAASGMTENVAERIALWREEHEGVEILLARGNHDRDLILPETWRIKMHEGGIVEEPFYFSHEPPAKNTEQAKLYSWTGHVHPTVQLRSRNDQLRLPCFALGRSHSLLPAFSAFTGGQNLKIADWERVFAIADSSVVEV